MKPFLKKVADVYALNEADRLYKYCFVLPNRRSRVFFESYLSDALNDKHSIFPELTTISDFIDEYSDLVEAGRVEQLFCCIKHIAHLRSATKSSMTTLTTFCILAICY